MELDNIMSVILESNRNFTSEESEAILSYPNIYIENILNLVKRFPSDKLEKALECFESKLTNAQIADVIFRCPSVEVKVILLKKYINVLSSYNIGIIIDSLPNNLKIELLDKYCNKLYLYDINAILKSIITDRILNMYGKKLEKDSGKIISQLKALIGYQAKLDYKELREENPSEYLPIGLSEILHSLSNKFNSFTLQYDTNVVKMKNFILKNYDKKAINSLFITLKSKKISDIEKLICILNKLNIKKVILAGKERDDLLKAYIEDITQNYDISRMFLISSNTNKITEEFRQIFIESTKRIFKKAFEEEIYKEEFGLLTQLCTYCLNIEQRLNEEEIKQSIESSIKADLVLTNKGKEQIYRRRVEKVIKSFPELKIVFESDKKFNEKMQIVFNSLYPKYEGVKSLETLYQLMLADDIFKELLTSELTKEELDTLPIEPQYYMINSNMQASMLASEILMAITRDNTELDNGYLSSEFKNRLNQIIKSLEEIKDISDSIELFKYDRLNILQSGNLGSLLLYYNEIKDFDELKNRNLTAENIDKFVDAARRINMHNTEYGLTLGEVCMKYISANEISDYYNHYINNTSKRFYSTIPSIHGTFDSYGIPLNYRTYKVDDPEQLVAGLRIKTIPSCFKLDDVQESTFEYITTNPNGTIIAIEDSEGRFLGRVYGFRIGDKVHFTRIYYNHSFDYKTAIKSISQKILDESNEINYITCIPFTGTTNQYMYGTTLFSKDLMYNQEREKIITDENTYSFTIVASRYKIDDLNKLDFGPCQITEKFYKSREATKTFNLSELNEIDKEIVIVKSSNIVCRSLIDKGILPYIKDADRITIGEDWIVIEKESEEPFPIKIAYDDTEYNKKVDVEISEYLNKIIIRPEALDTNIEDIQESDETGVRL